MFFAVILTNNRYSTTWSSCDAPILRVGGGFDLGKVKEGGTVEGAGDVEAMGDCKPASVLRSLQLGESGLTIPGQSEYS